MALEMADADPMPRATQRMADPDTSGVRRRPRVAEMRSVTNAGAGTSRVLGVLCRLDNDSERAV
jgi:hypothetical protein